IVDFTVEHNPDGFFAVRHWLMATAEIDDRQSSETKPQISIDVVTVVVRTSVHQGVRHLCDVVDPDWIAGAHVIKLTTHTAHRVLSFFFFRSGFDAST